MNDRLEYKLKRLCREDAVDWAGERTVQRAEGYLDRVGEIFAFDDFIAAKVRGTEEYTTNVFMDKYGEWNSVCTCPVRMNCKHGVALALCAAKKLNDGTAFPENEEGASLRLDRDAIVAEYKRVHEPPPPPPPPPPKVVHFKVEENPFGRFTAKGGRHAKDFSFRIVTSAEVYHWDFIVATLIYSLAKGGLSYSEGGSIGWREEKPGVEPAMFTCSCGDPHCGGFGDQQCEFSSCSVLWRVHYCGTIVELEFDRIHYEYWALQMLWRMRGSAKLRRDPWDSVTVDSGFTYAVASLLDARPRLRALWNLISEKRHVDEIDLVRISLMSSDANLVSADRCELRHFFPREFSTAGKIDLRQEEATCEEKWRVKERLSDVKITRGRFFVYSKVIGRHWETTELAFGQKIVFCRESGDDYHRHSLRVDDAADGRTIGYLRRKEAYWLTEMMDRHGLVLEGQVERIGRDGKMIPVRIDLCFADPKAEAMEWGASLKDGERLYFEMLRAVVLRPEICAASTIRSEAERIKKLFDVQTCPEIAFLLALLTAGAKEVAYRLTEEEIAKRRDYCNKVRKAMECEPVGGLLDADGLKVLPLRATFADPALDRAAARERMYRWIRLSWLSNGNEVRPKVHVPDFPPGATGFAVFRGRDLLDACLCGIPITDLGLFDSLAFYDGEGNSIDILSDGEAFGEVERFLGDLPVRERDKEGYSPRFWLERGIHDGGYDINEEGRLITLRILMLKARRQWVD